MGTRGAPIFSPAWEHRRKLQVRLPEPDVTKFIGLMLADPFPFFINIFDTAEQFAEIGATSGVFGSTGIAALASAEQRANVPEDFWLVALLASFSAGAVGTSFSFQLYHTRGAGETDEQGFTHQQSPIISGNMCGTAQKPLYLRVPKLLPRNTEISCTVQNLQNAFNQIQVCLLGYLGEPAGGLT
ncbi:MAG: hypothetical protein E6H00_12830 [Bacillati bacterium ANGP1]|uniref:Uncharacterized protein n=1 Tax=Candidatus Segetimicrobium genomatis TaxID=2569760 RepID=A0A537JXP4_9BACT|nr:MAG: hypothetical protein E6H00_12830 [Terrabacteria group bacterium ANGP1]